jgi:ParB/RepB/Spo0J family partition protein
VPFRTVMAMRTEDIPVEKVRKSPNYNPRRLTPTDELINHIGANGQLEPIIATENDDGTYDAHDGWQRTQAKRQLDHETVRAHIYDTVLEAARATGGAELQRSWTTYERVTHAGQLYNACRDRGYSKSKAHDEVAEILGYGRKTISDWISISFLDPYILELFKDQSDRSREKVEVIDRLNQRKNIHNQSKQLKIKNAELLSRGGCNLSTRELRTLAAHIFTERHEVAREIYNTVVLAGDSRNKSISQIAKEIRSASKTPGTINLDFQMSLDSDIHDANQHPINKAGSDARKHTEELWRQFGERRLSRQNGEVHCQFTVNGRTGKLLTRRAQNERKSADHVAQQLIEDKLCSADVAEFNGDGSS